MPCRDPVSIGDDAVNCRLCRQTTPTRQLSSRLRQCGNCRRRVATPERSDTVVADLRQFFSGCALLLLFHSRVVERHLAVAYFHHNGVYSYSVRVWAVFESGLNLGKVVYRKLTRFVRTACKGISATCCNPTKLFKSWTSSD